MIIVFLWLVHLQIQQYMKRSANKDLSFEQVKTLLAQLKALKLRLTEEELIQLVNLMPTSEVEMYLVRTNETRRSSPQSPDSSLSCQIVNNAADRLTEEQSTALLDTIRSFVPSDDANGGNGSAEPLDPDLAAEALAQYSTVATEKK
jgi:hypothetical protein